jgi:hypothetical protein
MTTTTFPPVVISYQSSVISSVSNASETRVLYNHLPPLEPWSYLFTYFFDLPANATTVAVTRLHCLRSEKTRP